MRGPDRNGHACRSPHRERPPHEQRPQRARLVLLKGCGAPAYSLPRPRLRPLGAPVEPSSRADPHDDIYQSPEDNVSRAARGDAHTLIATSQVLRGNSRRKARTGSRACGGPTQEIRITERDVAGTSGDVPPDVLEDDLDQDDPEPALRRPARSGTAGTGACSPGLPACRSPLDVRVRAEPPRAWRAARRSRTGTRNVKRVPLRAVARRNLSRLRAAGGD